MALLEKIKESLSSLTVEETSELQQYLFEMQTQSDAQRDSEPIPAGANREVVDTNRHGSVCYRLEKTKCGKKGCKCSRGQLHGPYWYAYYRENGRLKCKYIGKSERLFLRGTMR